MRYHNKCFILISIILSILSCKVRRSDFGEIATDYGKVVMRYELQRIYFTKTNHKSASLILRSSNLKFEKINGDWWVRVNSKEGQLTQVDVYEKNVFGRERKVGSKSLKIRTPEPLLWFGSLGLYDTIEKSWSALKIQYNLHTQNCGFAGCMGINWKILSYDYFALNDSVCIYRRMTGSKNPIAHDLEFIPDFMAIQNLHLEFGEDTIYYPPCNIHIKGGSRTLWYDYAESNQLVLKHNYSQNATLDTSEILPFGIREFSVMPSKLALEDSTLKELVNLKMHWEMLAQKGIDSFNFEPDSILAFGAFALKPLYLRLYKNKKLIGEIFNTLIPTKYMSVIQYTDSTALEIQYRQQSPSYLIKYKNTSKDSATYLPYPSVNGVKSSFYLPDYNAVEIVAISINKKYLITYKDSIGTIAVQNPENMEDPDDLVEVKKKFKVPLIALKP